MSVYSCFLSVCLWPPASRGVFPSRFLSWEQPSVNRKCRKLLSNGRSESITQTDPLWCLVCRFLWLWKLISYWNEMSSCAQRLVSAMLEEFMSAAVTEICQRVKVEPDEGSQVSHEHGSLPGHSGVNRTASFRYRCAFITENIVSSFISWELFQLK